MQTHRIPVVAHQQTRPIAPTRRSLSGTYPLRNGDGIPYESLLERDFLARMTFSSHVCDVIAQPVQIPFHGDGARIHTYTPDFLINYHLGDCQFGNYPVPLLVEVKPRDLWVKNWRKWLPKWKAAWRYAREQGWAFHIYDESRIRDTGFANIQFLDRYKAMDFSREESEWVVQTVREAGSVPVHYLLAIHFAGIYRGRGISHIWYLIATRQLDCDIRQPLNDFLDVWIPSP